MVTTLAGQAASGSINATGTAASFNYPSALTVDPAGNIYVVDGFDQIRKVTPQGVVTTFATSAALGVPTSGNQSFVNAITSDANGNVYEADDNVPNAGARIQKITPAGVVSIVATGSITNPVMQFSGDSGIAVDNAGNLYVADNNSENISIVTPGGSYSILAGAPVSDFSTGFVNGAGTAARFHNPIGLVVDGSGNVYVTDQGNSAIRKITQAGAVTTLAGGTAGSADGTGTAAQFTHLSGGIAIDGSGNLYVADGATIRKVSPAGVVTTVAGNNTGSQFFADGPALQAVFGGGMSLAFGPSSALDIADPFNNRIRALE